MEMKQEMINDAVDMAMESETNAEEEEKLIGQVLDELNIDITGNIANAPNVI